MINIFDLPIAQFNQLTSLDPTLDKDWKTDLMGIVLTLDKDSQQSIFNAVIKPKGITYDASAKQLIAQPQLTLLELLKTNHIANHPLQKATQALAELLSPPRH